jgi:hypothetical protein
MTDREIDHLAAQFKPVVIPDCVPIVEKDGADRLGPAPDLNVVFRTNRGGRLLVLPGCGRSSARSSGGLVLLSWDPGVARQGSTLFSLLIWAKAEYAGVGRGELGLR